LPSLLVAIAVVSASHALGGRAVEARQAMQRVRELDPSLRVSNLKDWLPIHRPDDLGQFADGLRLAGLPE
jgi:hypothetical protein